MPKLSKKSSKQSQFQRNAPELKAKPKPQPDGKANPVKAKKEVAPAKPIKVRLVSIPLAFGLKVMLEIRFFGFCLVALGIYVFAAFIASEWMYLLSSGFFMAAGLGLFLPLLQVIDVDAECSVPEEAIVTETASVRVKLKRAFRLGPISWVLPIKCLRLTVNLVRRGRDGKGTERILPPDPVLIASLVDEELFDFPTPELRRGVYYMDNVEVTSSFPLGLAWWARTAKIKKAADDKKASITVYPKVYPITGNFLFRLRGVTSLMGLASSSSVLTHQSTSFRTVREFKSGDSLRHIHWRSTARYGKLLVREFDSETIPVFDLLLDLKTNWRTTEQFELAVCTIHSLCHLGFRLGQLPELTLIPACESKSCQPLMADMPEVPPGLPLLSEILARVEPITANRGGEAPEEEETKVEFSSRPLLTLIPTSDKIMKHVPKLGDIVCYPVELAVVPQGWQDEEEEESKEAKADKSGVEFKKARPKVKDSRKLSKQVSGEVIARLEWEGDLAGL